MAGAIRTRIAYTTDDGLEIRWVIHSPHSHIEISHPTSWVETMLSVQLRYGRIGRGSGTRIRKFLLEREVTVTILSIPPLKWQLCAVLPRDIMVENHAN